MTKKRKLLFVLPALVIPFLTLGFWALGGGKKEGTPQQKKEGLNLQLPTAKLKNEDFEDKLSFYDRAEKDSEKLREVLSNYGVSTIAAQTAARYHQPLNLSPRNQEARKPEDEIMAKLATLREQVDHPVLTSMANREKDGQPYTGASGGSFLRREEGDTGDHEMEQMNTALDKILDIQHPERVKEKIAGKQVSKQVFSIQNLSTGPADDSLVFQSNAIEAVTDQAQILQNGSVIQLRLLDKISISGRVIPPGAMIYGVCSLNAERLEVALHSICYRNSIFPVKLEVYDLDGLAGIYIPGALTRDVARESADHSLQLMEMGSMDPSLKAQAAATGMSALKTLLTRKTKLVRVTVKAGYKILLKEKSTV